MGLLQVLIKTYSEISKEELHDILRLRNAVFVVEQNCIYQDIDGKDQKAFHVIGYLGDEMMAYARFFKKGDYFENASIGRVLVRIDQRKKGFAKQTMEATIAFMEKEIKTDAIELSAQTYLIDFYQDLGFRTEGEDYLEDGIPHIKMVRDKGL